MGTLTNEKTYGWFREKCLFVYFVFKEFTDVSLMHDILPFDVVKLIVLDYLQAQAY